MLMLVLVHMQMRMQMQMQTWCVFVDCNVRLLWPLALNRLPSVAFPLLCCLNQGCHILYMCNLP